MLLLNMNLFYFFASLVLSLTGSDLSVESSAPWPAEAAASLVALVAAHLLRTFPDILFRSSYFDPVDRPRCSVDPDNPEKKRLRREKREAARAAAEAAEAARWRALPTGRRLERNVQKAQKKEQSSSLQDRISPRPGGPSSCDRPREGDGSVVVATQVSPSTSDLRCAALQAEFECGPEGNIWTVPSVIFTQQDEPPPAYVVDFDISRFEPPVEEADGLSAGGIDLEDKDEVVVWSDPVVPPTNMWGPLSTRYLPVGAAVAFLCALLLGGTVHYANRSPRLSGDSGLQSQCNVSDDPWTRLAAVHLLIDALLVESGRMLLILLARYSKEDDNTVDFSVSTSRRLRLLLATDGHPVWRALVLWPDELFRSPL
jgi:hypothetical protein